MASIVEAVSNVFLILPAAQAYLMRRYTRCMVYLLVLVSSTLYHTCLVYNSACVLNGNTLKHMDFFFANFIIPLTALYVIYFPPHWYFLERFLIVAVAFINLILILLFDDAFGVQLGLAAGSFGAIVVYWVGYTCYAKRTTGNWAFPPYNWDYFALGIACTGVACSLYTTQIMNHLYYSWIHGCWHMVAAFGQYFLLQIRPWAPENLSLDAQMLEQINGTANPPPPPPQRKRKYVHHTPHGRV